MGQVEGPSSETSLSAAAVTLGGQASHVEMGTHLNTQQQGRQRKPQAEEKACLAPPSQLLHQYFMNPFKHLTLCFLIDTQQIR